MQDLRKVLDDYYAEKRAKEQEQRRSRPAQEPRLWVSSLGGCVRRAFYAAFANVDGHPLQVKETHPFDEYVVYVMEQGNELGVRTRTAFEWKWSGHLATEVPLRNSIWSGRIDFLVAQTEEFPEGAIIEHKGTNPFNFRAKDRLPYKHHVYQVLAYQRLLANIVGYRVPAYLFYRGWTERAQFRVYQDDGTINYIGMVNGYEREGDLGWENTIEEEMSRFALYWGHDELPPGYEHPFEVRFGCTKTVRKGKALPACPFFGICWPGQPQDSLLEVG